MASADEVGGLPILLALALAGRTVEVMGGVLEADANPGCGVTVGFKAVCSPPTWNLATTRRAPVRGGRNAHILVVDDNATNRMVVEALCEMFDCSTESVVDGVEAVEAARAGRFDVILMDIKMPRMDGVDRRRGRSASSARRPARCRSSRSPPTPTRTKSPSYLAAGMRAWSKSRSSPSGCSRRSTPRWPSPPAEPTPRRPKRRPHDRKFTVNYGGRQLALHGA